MSESEWVANVELAKEALRLKLEAETRKAFDSVKYLKAKQAFAKRYANQPRKW